MDDELRYRRLEMLKRVMDNPLWHDIMKEVSSQIAAEIMVTAPQEAAKRELLYLEQAGAKRFLGRLNGMCSEVVFTRSKLEKQNG